MVVVAFCDDDGVESDIDGVDYGGVLCGRCRWGGR